MATAKRQRPSRGAKGRAATRPRRPSTRATGQGGLAALAIALLLGALGLSRSWFESGGPPDAGQREAATTGAAPSGGERATSSAAEDALLDAINRARVDNDRSELRESAPLARAARAHSADLRATSRCSHDGSDGSSLADRLRTARADVQRYGEVVACGSASADAAVAQWLDSDAHRDIVLDPAYRTVGVGVAPGASTSDARWTAVLGTP